MQSSGPGHVRKCPSYPRVDQPLLAHFMAFISSGPVLCPRCLGCWAPCQVQDEEFVKSTLGNPRPLITTCYGSVRLVLESPGSALCWIKFRNFYCVRFECNYVWRCTMSVSFSFLPAAILSCLTGMVLRSRHFESPSTLSGTMQTCA